MGKNQNNPGINYKEILIALAFIVILVASGFFVGLKIGKEKGNDASDSESNTTKTKTKEIRQSGYEFINPLLECDVNDVRLIRESFKNEAKEKISEMISKNFSDIQYSVYFRDLQNGPWFGINETSDFSPASLMKVPIMIAYFKEAEKDPAILLQEINYRDIGADDGMFYQSSKKGIDGNEYAVGELIEMMIIGSDNNALTVLFQNMEREKIAKVFSDLGIRVPDFSDFNDVITVKDYASFFRILYNASYLNREMSEKSLSLLSRVEYKDALRSSVPDNIKVAHKFGERSSLIDQKYSRQLHDCGIVYYPGYNYLVCIMTRGDDFGELSKAISEMGKIIYSEVEKTIDAQ
jgi:beta-lactamase class A